MSSARAPSFVDIDQVTEDSDNALMLAVTAGNVDEVRRLLSDNSAIDRKNCHGLTPLHLAVRQNNSCVVDLLLKQGARTDVQDSDGDTPLIEASCKGFLQCVQLILRAELDSPIKSIDLRGSTSSTFNTALHEAVYRQHLPVVQTLIAHGAKVNNMNIECMTPLTYACLGGNLDIISCLVRAGANVNAIDLHFESPLHSLAIADNIPEHTVNAAAKVLIKAGANINSVGHFQCTVLQLAVECNHELMVGTLIRAHCCSATRTLRTVFMHGLDAGKSYPILSMLYLAGAPVFVEGRWQDIDSCRSTVERLLESRSQLMPIFSKSCPLSGSCEEVVLRPPRSLKLWTRKVICRCLGQEATVDDLSACCRLPRTLLDYLKFSEFDGILEKWNSKK